MREPEVVAGVRLPPRETGMISSRWLKRVRVAEFGVDGLVAEPAAVLFGEDLGAQFAPTVAVGVAGDARPP